MNDQKDSEILKKCVLQNYRTIKILTRRIAELERQARENANDLTTIEHNLLELECEIEK